MEFILTMDLKKMLYSVCHGYFARLDIKSILAYWGGGRAGSRGCPPITSIELFLHVCSLELRCVFEMHHEGEMQGEMPRGSGAQPGPQARSLIALLHKASELTCAHARAQLFGWAGLLTSPQLVLP